MSASTLATGETAGELDAAPPEGVPLDSAEAPESGDALGSGGDALGETDGDGDGEGEALGTGVGLGDLVGTGEAFAEPGGTGDGVIAGGNDGVASGSGGPA